MNKKHILTLAIKPGTLLRSTFGIVISNSLFKWYGAGNGHGYFGRFGSLAVNANIFLQSIVSLGALKIKLFM